MDRPTKDEYFMKMAFLVASRSTCLRRSVGAVIVKDGHVMSTGYNGAPKGLAHCDETGCTREKMKVPSGERHELCRGLHAEQNAIIQAAKLGVNIDLGKIYITNHPCSVCAKMLINANISEVVYANDYVDSLAKEMMEQSGVMMRKFDVKGLEK